VTTPEQPPSLPPAIDVLGPPQPVERGRRRGTLAAALVGAGALVIAGGAVAVAALLSGGGAQPEDVLPAQAMGLVKLDLDPSAGQKVAIYRLAKRFPTVSDDVRDQGEIKDQLLSALFADVGELDYASEVQPWIGDRVGAAMVPGAELPQALVAIAYTDRARAEAAMRTLQASEDELFYGFSQEADYLLVGSSQAVVDDAVAPAQVLADSDAWQKGMDALDGDQIVTAWGDLGAVWAALPPEARAEAAELYGLETDFALSGTVVAGLRAGDDHVELIGKAIDIESPLQLESAIGGGRGSGLVQGLPAETVAALSITNLGAGVAELFDTAFAEQDPLGLVAGAEGLGLTLPDDLRTLLGDETLVAAFDASAVGLRARTADVDQAYDAAQSLAALLTGGTDPAQVLRRLDDGLAIGSTPEALEAITTTDGGLGDSEAFRAAVPDADEAGYLVYVDVARAIELSGEELGADAGQLRSFGLSGSGDNRNSTFRLRLTVRD
jgi:hypothetical protein